MERPFLCCFIFGGCHKCQFHDDNYTVNGIHLYCTATMEQKEEIEEKFFLEHKEW